MTSNPAPEVRREIVVPAALQKAFEIFTERFGDFKPPEHNLLAVPIAQTCFEARVGGHIYDRGVDGSECRWARILAYEPPVPGRSGGDRPATARVVFSWDIGPTWQVVSDPDTASEVEVTFVAETADRTRVELVHRHLDRHGPGWPSVAGGISGDGGWSHYLERYAALVG
jgi:hypothetical protein